MPAVLTRAGPGPVAGRPACVKVHIPHATLGSSIMVATDTILGHVLPECVDIEVRDQDGVTVTPP